MTTSAETQAPETEATMEMVRALERRLDEVRGERDAARRRAEEIPDAEWGGFEDRIAAFEEAVRGHRVLDVPEARDALRSAFRALRAEVRLLTHKVITCGVAASHPDPALSRRAKDYGGKWDSPQAEEVRKVRAERDALAERLAQAEAAVRDWISEVERMDRVANGWQEEAFAAGRRADRLRLRLARVCMWGWSQRAPWRNPGVWSGRVAAPPGDGR